MRFAPSTALSCFDRYGICTTLTIMIFFASIICATFLSVRFCKVHWFRSVSRLPIETYWRMAGPSFQLDCPFCFPFDSPTLETTTPNLISCILEPTKLLLAMRNGVLSPSPCREV